MTSLNWFWIAIALTVPGLAGALIAYPFWRTGQPIFGNIVGSVIVFGTAIGLIMREHVELDRVVQACIERGVTCWPEPSPFTRYAIYAFIALFQVMALFTISIRVDQSRRRQPYAPEWR